jgi:hypothetical protein
VAGRLIVVLALALVAAGCAEPAPPTLATGTVAEALPLAVWPTDPSLVTDVECPDLDPTLIAQSGVCGARIAGDPVTIEVVIDDEAGTTATVREPLFDVAAAGVQLAARIRSDLSLDADVSLSVQCAPGVVVARAGAVVSCIAERSGDPIGFELDLLDETGAWSLRYAG